jgi:hypothetical protein
VAGSAFIVCTAGRPADPQVGNAIEVFTVILGIAIGHIGAEGADRAVDATAFRTEAVVARVAIEVVGTRVVYAAGGAGVGHAVVAGIAVRVVVTPTARVADEASVMFDAIDSVHTLITIGAIVVQVATVSRRAAAVSLWSRDRQVAVARHAVAVGQARVLAVVEQVPTCVVGHADE